MFSYAGTFMAGTAAPIVRSVAAAANDAEDLVETLLRAIAKSE